MVGAEAGSMGESTWSEVCCTAPVAVGWQALLVRTLLP
jgi:hypothetical protein